MSACFFSPQQQTAVGYSRVTGNNRHLGLSGVPLPKLIKKHAAADTEPRDLSNTVVCLSSQGHAVPQGHAKWSLPDIASCVFSRSCSYPICTADGRLRKRWGGGRRRGGKVMGCTEKEAERQEWNEGAGRRRKKEKWDTWMRMERE